jgi:hypothetical protein
VVTHRVFYLNVEEGPKTEAKVEGDRWVVYPDHSKAEMP